MATPLSEPNEEILQHFLCSGPLIFYGARVAVFIFPGVVILFLTDEYSTSRNSRFTCSLNVDLQHAILREVSCFYFRNISVRVTVPPSFY